MDYLFRLADGRRLALWSEKNQIIRQLSGGGGNRSHITLRTDFLSDFSAVAIDGKIYFAYQNTSRRVMLYLPDGEEDRILFGESIESCRHSGMTLTSWKGKLYLFYLAFSPIRERYSLKVRKLLDNGQVKAGEDYEPGEEHVLAQDLEMAPEFHVVAEKECLRIMTGKKGWQLELDESGVESWQEGSWINEAGLSKQKEKEKEVEGLNEAVTILKEKVRQAEADRKNSQSETEKFCGENQRLSEKVEQIREKAEALQQEIRSLRGDRKQYMEEIERLEEENEKLRLEQEQEVMAYRAKLQSAVAQYNELAGITRQLQTEGKKWRDKYFQEAKKRREKTAAVKAGRTAE